MSVVEVLVSGTSNKEKDLSNMSRLESKFDKGYDCNVGYGPLCNMEVT